MAEMIAEDRVVVVLEKDPRRIDLYPAVIVWRLSNGLAWVRPGYLDPYAALSPQFQKVIGPLSESGQALIVDGSEFQVMIEPVTEPPEGILQALAWYGEELKRRGLDREEEAARVERLLAEDLA